MSKVKPPGRKRVSQKSTCYQISVQEATVIVSDETKKAIEQCIMGKKGLIHGRDFTVLNFAKCGCNCKKACECTRVASNCTDFCVW